MHFDLWTFARQWQNKIGKIGEYSVFSIKVGIAVFGAGVISRFVGQKIICGTQKMLLYHTNLHILNVFISEVYTSCQDKIKMYLPRDIGEFVGSNSLCIEAAHYNFDFVQNVFIFLPFSLYYHVKGNNSTNSYLGKSKRWSVML